MIQFEQVLCPTDLSDASARALAHAAALARWYEAKLTVQHVAPTFDSVPMRSGSLNEAVAMAFPVSQEDVTEEMRRMVERVGATTLDPTLVAELGDPARTIVDTAVSIPADLLVMGTHGRSGFERFVLGSVTEKVLRRAPCPVLTVPPHTSDTPSDEVLFKNILCAIDFSPASAQALGFALDLARQANGSVTLVHSIEWLAEEEPRTYAHFNVPEFRRHLIADAREQLHALVAGESGTWAAIEEVVTVGRAHREVLRLAEESPTDLIVMGAQGRGGVGLALFGSTTHQVVRGAPCPVLTVRGVRAAAAV